MKRISTSLVCIVIGLATVHCSRKPQTPTRKAATTSTSTTSGPSVYGDTLLSGPSNHSSMSNYTSSSTYYSTSSNTYTSTYSNTTTATGNPTNTFTTTTTSTNPVNPFPINPVNPINPDKIQTFKIPSGNTFVDLRWDGKVDSFQDPQLQPR